MEERICSACGKPMHEGYCIGDGLEYYCSETCLHTVYTQEEYRKMFVDDNAYWSQWED